MLLALQADAATKSEEVDESEYNRANRRGGMSVNRRTFLAMGPVAALAAAGHDRGLAAQATPDIAAHPDFRVRFVRHAESEINVQRTIDVPGATLPPDSGVTFPLTQTGMEEAAALGEAMRNDPVLAIVSSTRLRCLQTADAIALPHAMPVALAPGLVEVAFTDPESSFSTVDWVAVMQAMTSWMMGGADAHAPGGESLTEVLARFVPAAREAIAHYQDQPGELVFVSHSVVMSAALPSLFPNLSLDWTLTHVLPHTGSATGAFVDGALVCTDWDGAAPG